MHQRSRQGRKEADVRPRTKWWWRESWETVNKHFFNDPTFQRNLKFSEECVFQLTGSVNKHNNHYWSATNPQERIRNQSQIPYLTAWESVSFYGIVNIISCIIYKQTPDKLPRMRHFFIEHLHSELRTRSFIPFCCSICNSTLKR